MFMKFKGIICLTKVNKNQTQTERNENTIIFNDSKIEIIDNDSLYIYMKDREVLLLGSGIVNKELEKVDINWVNLYENCEEEVQISESNIDVFLITRSVYDKCLEIGLNIEEIYRNFKLKGLGFLSGNLLDIEDFSVLKAQIVE